MMNKECSNQHPAEQTLYLLERERFFADEILDDSRITGVQCSLCHTVLPNDGLIQNRKEAHEKFHNPFLYKGMASKNKILGTVSWIYVRCDE